MQQVIMSRIHKLTFISAIVFLLFSVQSCKTKSDDNILVKAYEEIATQLLDAMEYELDHNQLNSLSIALVDGDQLVFSSAIGYEDAEKTIKASPRTIYRAGSVSKLFTDLAIIQAVEKGDLDLDEDIRKYLPEFNPKNPFTTPITLRQLVSHHSGLLREPLVGNYFDHTGTKLKTTVESVNQSRLIYAPGTKAKYSNAGIAVAGYVLEKLYHENYESFIKKQVLKPLGMESSAFQLEEALKGRLADASMWSYDGREFPAPQFELGMSPAGSLYTTMPDLAKFLIMLNKKGQGTDGQILSEESLAKMLKPQFSQNDSIGYGLGFAINRFQDALWIGHGGAIYGFATQLSSVPELRIGVACASSTDVSNAIVSRISNYGLKLLYAQQQKLDLPAYQKTSPLNQDDIDRLAGTYENESGLLRLKKKSNGLHLETDQFEVPIRKMENSYISDGKLDFGSIKIMPSGESIQVNGSTFQKTVAEKSFEYPQTWNQYFGEYGPDHNILFIFEDLGELWALIEWTEKDKLTHASGDTFNFPEQNGMYQGERLIFSRKANGEISRVSIENGPVFIKRDIGASTSETFKIKPLLSIDSLRKMALNATPPIETGDFITHDLVELNSLDSSILYDIRYASTNNFMSSTFYQIPSAYMQRPAAEALVRAHKELKKSGYGLMIHDAYRPWYVTKMFWDATPEDKKIFVANPANGSRHNRGCAIDLTLYDLQTEKVVEMVAGYDEMTERSYPDYYGGTTEQRWHRSLLRKAMEAQGFKVYAFEWWHFDYKDWKKYAIGNTRFEDL